MKIRKMIAVVLTAGFLIVILSSCRQLDEAKKHTAYWLDDECRTIEWQGKKYIRSETMRDELNIRTAGDIIYVVERDVPVMLSSGLGMNFQTDKGERILCCSYGQHISFYSSGYKAVREVPYNALYIREDLVDGLIRDIQEGKTDHYCMNIWTETGEDSVLLSEELSDRLDRAMKEGKALTVDDIYGDRALPDYSWILGSYEDLLTVEYCDSSMLLRGGEIRVYAGRDSQDQRMVMMEVSRNNAEYIEYYLLKDTGLYDELKKIEFENYHAPAAADV